jgi:4-amino-4-deoxy-L-arabinose transferase-like glycosyltransferase
MTPRRAVLAALVAFVAVNLLFLGARPVLTADETRYGSIAAQMAESGDWLHLRMSGFRFYEKPPLTYWMTAASIEAFGRNGFAIRLPTPP